MKDAPVDLTIQLWSLGHSGGQIAKMLGYPNFRHVHRIIKHARDLGDKRAVRHANGSRILGKAIPREKRLLARKIHTLDGIEVVPIIHNATCIHGHPRLGNVDRRSRCLTCKRMKR